MNNNKIIVTTLSNEWRINNPTRNVGNCKYNAGDYGAGLIRCSRGDIVFWFNNICVNTCSEHEFKTINLDKPI